MVALLRRGMIVLVMLALLLALVPSPSALATGMCLPHEQHHLMVDRHVLPMVQDVRQAIVSLIDRHTTRRALPWRRAFAETPARCPFSCLIIVRPAPPPPAARASAHR